MLSQKKSTVVFGIIFAAAVLFFIGIVVFAKWDDTTAASSQTVDTAFVMNEMRVNVDWNKDRSCKITQNLTVEFNSARHGIFVDIPVNSGERVRNLTVDVKDDNGAAVMYTVEHESRNRIVRVRVGDEYEYLNSGEHLYCTLKYDYLTPEHPENENFLDINAVGFGWSCVIENAVVTVNFPVAVRDSAVSVWIGGDKRNFTLTDGGKTVNLATGRLNAYHGVRVKAEMPDGVLESAQFEGIVTTVVGVVLVAAAILLMVFLGKDKPLTPVVGFYPPQTDGKTGRKRRMLPVQLGKIIDGKCSSDDVTSLIFYWASEGYIKIDDTGSDTYLIKLNDVDPVTEYERVLFNELFKKAKRNDETGEARVSISSLSGGFADKINAVKSGVNSEFRGGFFKKSFTALSVGLMLATALFAVLNSLLCTLRIYNAGFPNMWLNIVGVFTVVPIVLAYILGTMLVRTYFKLGDTRRKVFLTLYFAAVILLSVAVMLAVPTDAMGWTEKIIFALAIGIASAIAPFLTRRKDEYTEQLNEIIGFRNFLRDAEKPQLEMLLQDDPQYYYDILPYANVLGVSEIWQDKFAGLSIDPPTYYYGGNASVFDIVVISSLSRSIGSSLSYVPPKVSGGSFSGGGFSGGGRSGGGFGGGGGGSW